PVEQALCPRADHKNILGPGGPCPGNGKRDPGPLAGAQSQTEQILCPSQGGTGQQKSDHGLQGLEEIGPLPTPGDQPAYRQTPPDSCPIGRPGLPYQGGPQIRCGPQQSRWGDPPSLQEPGALAPGQTGKGPFCGPPALRSPLGCLYQRLIKSAFSRMIWATGLFSRWLSSQDRMSRYRKALFS